MGWECAYCGRSPSKKKNRQRDHVPPRCLFRRPFPDDLVTAPACSDCHKGTNLDDEYLRIVLTIREDVAGHPEADLERTHRALEGPSRSLARSLARLSEQIPVTSPGGIHHLAAIYQVDRPRLERVISRITMGLFYNAQRCRLPEAYVVRAWTEPEWEKLTPRLRRLLAGKLFDRPAMEIGKGRRVFEFRAAFDTKDPSISAWLFMIYGVVEFFSFTVRRDAELAQLARSRGIQ